MKADPTRVISAHYATLVDDRTGRPMIGDFALFLGAPVLVGGYCVLQSVKLPSGASVGLLTVSGLMSALFLGVMLQISQRAMDFADAHRTPSADVTDQAEFLRQIAASSGYASLVSFLASGLFVVASATSKTVLICFSAIGLAVLVHLAVMLLMVIRRVFAITEQRLNVAQTNAEVRRIPQRKTG